MLAIKFKFLAGGYHASTWGRRANDEAAAEWPPSPWRIVRALTAVWKQFLPDLSESEVSPIIEKLASERPKFHLPPAAVAHSRHYMPLGETKREEKTRLRGCLISPKRVVYEACESPQIRFRQVKGEPTWLFDDDLSALRTLRARRPRSQRPLSNTL